MSDASKFIGGKHIHKFGYNADVDTGTDPEDVWIVGGIYVWPTAAAETNIVSSSVADAAAGTGARTVVIEGLDAAWNIVEETVTLNGTTQVILANQLLRAYRAYVVTAGSGEVNAGNIDIRHGATVLARISADDGQTLQALFSIPADYYGAWLHRWHCAIGNATAGVARLKLQTREDGKAWRTREIITLDTAGDSQWEFGFDDPIFLPEKTDIRLRADQVSVDNTEVSGGFHVQYWESGPGCIR